jgi:outer membrane protein TolC
MESRFLIGVVSIGALALSGCVSIQPVPVSKEEVAQRVMTDRAKMFADQEPIRAPLTFADAAARAVKYNLDYRLKQMETALQLGMTDLSRWDMLPKLVANAGYTARNNDLATRSFSTTAGNITQPAGNTYTGSQDRKHLTAGIDLSWNLLDFGVSYYRAKQQGDQRMIANERSRRVAQNIIQDANVAYWRALGAQRLLAQVEATMKRAESALQRARQIETQGLMPQAQALAYQRALLDATTLLAFRRQDLELAKLELSMLMNMAPGSEFTLADTQEAKLPGAPADITRLEDLALKQRPELAEEDYRVRITSMEAKKQFWSILPGLGVNLGMNYDNNQYLLNSSWAEAGLRLGMNLMKLAALPAQNRVNQAQTKVDEMRRLSQGMAIMSQVRIAAMRYNLAMIELQQVDESAKVDQRLLNYARASQTSRVDSELEVIRNEARSVLSSYQRHVAYANAQAAWSRLYNSVGYDVSDLDSAMSLGQLSNTIERSMNSWRAVTFGTAAADTMPALAGVSILVENVTDPALKESIRSNIEQAFARYNVPVTDAPGNHRVVARVEMLVAGSGPRRASYQFTVLRPNGTVAGRTNYSGLLPSQITSAVVASMTQSAIDANAQALVDWLQIPGDMPASNVARAPAKSVPVMTESKVVTTAIPAATILPVVSGPSVAASVAGPAAANSARVAPAGVTEVKPRAAPVYRPTLTVQ